MSLKETILDFGRGYSSAMGSIRNIATAAGNYTNKVQSLLGKKDSPASIRDLYTNGFITHNSIYNPNFFVRAFDEPTYLTFRIEFLTNPAETAFRNTAFNNNGISQQLNSPLYATMFDYMPEPFLEDFKVVNIGDSSTGRLYSTEGYLDMNLGDHGRAAMLHNFKAALKDIEKNFPFYFKSISGLESLTNVNPSHGARLQDAEIVIECEEGLDLKITQLINMYRKIVWDDTYQRWILPDMMRYFGMRIYISEIRLFHNMERRGVFTDPLTNLLGNKNSPTYDFSNDKVRNATYLPLDKKDAWETINNAVNTGTALSNAFLGANTYITKAVNYVREAEETIGELNSGIGDIFNDIMLCNNAINDVMPTICFECHMCEFDIASTMGYIGELHSSTHETSAVSPLIKIKIGQVKEKQAYPLNKFLKSINGRYTSNINSDYNTTPSGEMNSFSELSNERDNGMGYQGQYFSDEVLNKRYSSEKLKDRISEYNNNLGHSMGDTKAQSISRSRLGKEMNDNLEEMNYSMERSSQRLAAISLTASALNEAADLFGTEDSTAINPSRTRREQIENLGEILKEAADRIYNGSELKSLALTDEIRAQIANQYFERYINGIASSQATTSQELKDLLIAYRKLRDEDEMRFVSTATSRNEIKNFSIING